MTFHQVLNWVIVRGLEKLGYKVNVVDQIRHQEMYPMFTGVNGDYPTIDIVTGADLPYNHIQYLGPNPFKPDEEPVPPPANWTPTEWFTIGSINEGSNIFLASPSGSGQTKVSDMKDVPSDFEKEIIMIDPVTCPRCMFNMKIFLDRIGGDWKPKFFANNAEFLTEVRAKLDKGDTKFMVLWFEPSYLNGRLPELKKLQVTEPWPSSTINVGKILVRYDRYHKLTEQAKIFLASAFIGNEANIIMDEWQLTMGPQAAADKWIAENENHFNMYLNRFNYQPDN